jgi:ADP-heptose:LPS heptosyltransferase
VSGRSALVVRLDSMGDMLVSGPAIRAVAAAADGVTVLAGPRGAEAARLLPGVEDVVVWQCPWIAAAPPPVREDEVREVVERVRALAVDEALVLTSFHQSALPTALVLRMAGVPRIAAISDDYPGSLLDVRIPSPADAPEPERMLAVARAAGYSLPPDDDGRLAVIPTAEPAGLPDGPYLVLHPGADAPARAYPEARWRQLVAALTAAGRTAVVTGGPGETALTAAVAGAGGVDLGGRLNLAELAAVLRRADAVVVANTGPAHLAAAVGTPVVSLFAPVVPSMRWAPYGVALALLGDQQAACRGTRARSCPVPGHPCLSEVSTADILAALDAVARVPERAA